MQTNGHTLTHYLFVSSPKRSGDPRKVLAAPKIPTVFACPCDFR